MKTPPPLPSIEQIVADALNEQGFLFQHKIATVLLAPEKADKAKHKWQLEAAEVPVSLPNGSETKIDLILRLGPESNCPVRVVVECKRSSRDFKKWIFFAQNEIAHNPSPQNYYAERAHLRQGWDGRSEPDIIYTIAPKPASEGCSVFDYGVEARVGKPSSEKRVSATDAIEDACQQVTLGQAGLGQRLRNSHIVNFRNLPVVATTAELMSAHFEAHNVSLDRGMIDPKKIKVRPRKWLAVNFRIMQAISACIPMGLHNKIPLAAELAMRQVRTVFIVQAEHIHEFLAWLEGIYPSATD